MKKPTILCLVTALAMMSASVLAADPITLELDPVFDNYNPSFGCFPVAVTLTNTGPNATGVVRVSSSNSSFDYPVELPTGAKKRIVTYGRADYSGLNFQLITNRGNIIQPYQPQSGFVDTSEQAIAVVGDVSGQMSYLRGKSIAGGRSMQDVYTRPALAPDRSVGYSGIGAVVLADGTERLSNEQVRALKLYALMGGTLVFVGGASPAAVRDARWAEVMPARNLHPVTQYGSSAISKMGGQPLKGEITFSVGDALEGTTVVKDGEVPLTYERPFGLGRVMLYSFDPFEAPLEGYGGMAAVVMSTLNPADQSRVRNYLQAYMTESQNPGRSTVPPGMHVPSVREDPFSMELPPSGKVFGLLFLYALLVVPVNFLVLRKLNRGEMAWFTAPIISVGFAGLLFASARSLYVANLSSASQGVLVMQEGMGEGAFLGTTQLFIPQGGTYDLKMSGVDSLGMIEQQAYEAWGRQNQTNTAELQPIDVGEVRVPAMHAANLAFREIYYRQIVPTKDWFSVRRLTDGRYEVKNDSPYTLRSASLSRRYASKRMGDLAPGKKVEVSFENGGTNGVYGPRDVRNFTGPGGAIALSGSLPDFRPGPQIGQEVGSRKMIDAVFFASGDER
jgi:hypothetical protein